ncbi:hypothetical protein J6590_041219 [Homalodisca vitripennis]|nr:hypothetical protein J6590_041219 [Homalodisca vitripennis]
MCFNWGRQQLHGERSTAERMVSDNCFTPEVNSGLNIATIVVALWLMKTVSLRIVLYFYKSCSHCSGLHFSVSQ